MKFSKALNCQFTPTPLKRRIFVIVLLAYFNGTRSSVLLSCFCSTRQTVRAFKHVGSLDKGIVSVSALR